MQRAKNLESFYEQLRHLDYTYPEQGASLGVFPKGYDHDDNKVLLGTGESIFQKARTALSDWRMFPKAWTIIHYPESSLREGAPVALGIRLLGKWWYCGSRIVYTLNDKNRFGFAYGTLPLHVEKGEELFVVERDDTGAVYFRIRAFSRPNRWYVRLAYPFARLNQKRFVRDALQQMKTLCQE